jgi:uncharacterized protein with LGFP repeats
MPSANESTSIVQTPDGEVVVRGRIHVKWEALGAVLTPDGDDAKAHLEHPLGEQAPIPASRGGGAVQFFVRGMIVERVDGRTFVIYGAIYDHYVKIGGAASAIGLPTSDEEGAPRGGRVSHFERGDIYWRADVGARDVRGIHRAAHAKRDDPCALSLIDRVVARWGRIATRLGLIRPHRA